jgi:hypothetical protein
VVEVMTQTKRDTPNPKVLCVACLYPCRWGEWHMSNVSQTEPLGNRAASQSMQSYTGTGSSACADLLILPYSWDYNGH